MVSKNLSVVSCEVTPPTPLKAPHGNSPPGSSVMWASRFLLLLKGEVCYGPSCRELLGSGYGVFPTTPVAGLSVRQQSCFLDSSAQHW